MHKHLMNSTAIRFAADDGAASGGTAEAATEFNYSESREFFEPADLEKAQARANAISQNMPDVSVIGFSGDWPAGAGACILPLARNEARDVLKDGKPTGEKETYRKTYAVLVWPYFPYEAVVAANGGEAYLRTVLQADQAAAILNPLRRQRWEKSEFDTSSCPTSLQDHIEGMRGDRGIIAPYMEAAKKLLPKLKEMSAAFAAFTPQSLRQILQSKPMAMQFAPKLEEKGFWLGIIDKLEAVTKADGGNVEIYQRWRDTRDQEAEIDLDTLTLDDLKV